MGKEKRNQKTCFLSSELEERPWASSIAPLQYSHQMVIQQPLNILHDRELGTSKYPPFIFEQLCGKQNSIALELSHYEGRSKGQTFAGSLWEALKGTALVFASLSLTKSDVSKGRGWVWSSVPISWNMPRYRKPSSECLAKELVNQREKLQDLMLPTKSFSLESSPFLSFSGITLSWCSVHFWGPSPAFIPVFCTVNDGIFEH